MSIGKDNSIARLELDVVSSIGRGTGAFLLE